MPGLLQTTDDSLAMFVASLVRQSHAKLDDAVAVRSIRQERLTSTDHPLELRAIIDESVLHRPVGGEAVFALQLRHLPAAAAMPTVTIQVLPMSVGAHPAMASPFTILNFGELGEPDMACVEHSLGALNLAKEADVARAKMALDRLRSDALSQADSAALIGQVADSA